MARLSVTSGSDFRYKALADRQFIRLLEILPRIRPGDDIQCKLRYNVVLKDSTKPGYTAISYEWGNPAASRKIIKIDGCSFEVRQNLYNFLYRLSGHCDIQYRILWIDAICIDQNNVIEKNHQVQQMHHIYRAAERVFLWLGEAADGSDLAADCFNNIRHAASRSLRPALPAIARIKPTWDGVFGEIAIENEQQKTAVFDALSALCHRPYFSRIWVHPRALASSDYPRVLRLRRLALG